MATATDPKHEQESPNTKQGSRFAQSDPVIETLPLLWKRIDPELKTTGGFIMAAVISLAITGALAIANRPAPIKEFGKVGQDFYPDFADPTRAIALEVYAFDKDDVKPLDFRVKRLNNGRWVIPSHHDYPADAEDQLAKTAASIIGIKRGAMVTRWEADHSRYGVVNPKQDALSVDEVEGVGKRIMLRGESYNVLADYIIGNKVDGSTDEYYVRHPEEDEVYIAKLDIDLSTKFTDWIETDLLDVDSWDIREVVANNYSFDELKGQLTNREVTALSRKTSSDDWKLDGLNDETEEVNKDAVRDMINAIGDLKIFGVRPKQKGLTPELRLDREALSGQKDVDRLQADLLARGFLLQPGENGDQENLKLLAREGELTTATDDGLVYQLHFGRVFTGSQEELETGFSSKDDEEADTTNKADSGDAKSQVASTSMAEDDEANASDVAKSSDEAEKEEKTDTNKPGRYVFVRVDFNEKYLGEEPIKPTEPAKPAELTEAEAAKEQEPQPDAADNETSDEAAEAEKEDPLADIRKEYDEAKKKYDDDLKAYESKVADRNKKMEDGKEKAEELNRRFADWYYVIPGDSFDKLKFARADLVKDKEKKDEETEGDNTDAAEDKAAATNQAAADKFLAENKEKSGVITTDSGLQYEVITKGEGESPQASSRVKVKYKGTLLDGAVFDESGDEAVEFGVDQVIKGWTEALQLMKPGAKWKLYIPPGLAYGERGSGNKIGTNSLLTFEVELVSFEE
jgi:FKBP-type peptidyl-prolyl cis-trans isomerase